jgi:histone H3/H4
MNNDYVLTKPLINRLIRKAGIKRVDALFYEEFRGIFLGFLKNIIENTVIFVKADRKKPINIKYLLKAIKDLHGPQKKQHRKIVNECKQFKFDKNATNTDPKWLQEARFYQKQFDCIYIPESVFKNILIKMTDGPLRWSQEASDYLQVYLEELVLKLLENARYLASYLAGRETIQPKDLHSVIQVSQYNIPFYNLIYSKKNQQIR